VKELEALGKSKQAEIESLKSAVLQANQSLRDAQRNLEDCTLYSSFRGQVAEVSVVPGSVVKAGEPVVTLQMMDPIKIEMEVSAQQSRRLRRTDVHPVHVTTH
jgi:multidrug resistance efflux pump